MDGRLPPPRDLAGHEEVVHQRLETGAYRNYDSRRACGEKLLEQRIVVSQQRHVIPIGFAPSEVGIEELHHLGPFERLVLVEAFLAVSDR